jgi:outer membrane protein assembly factor BamB
MNSSARMPALLCVLMLTGSCGLFGPGERPPNRVLWELPVAAAQWTGIPATDGVRAFVQVDSGMISLDPKNGSKNWYSNLHIARGPTSLNIAHDRGSLYMVDRLTVYSLSASDGTLRWQVTPAERPDEAEVATDGSSVYVGTRAASVLALDAATGGQLWTSSFVQGWPYGGVVTGFGISGDTLYASGAEYLRDGGYLKRGVVKAYDRRTGAQLAEFKATDSSSSAGGAVIIAGNLLLLSDLVGGSFFAVDRFTMALKWRVFGDPTSFGPTQAPIVLGDTVFVGSADQFAYAANLETGQLYWKTYIGGSVLQFALCRDLFLGNNQDVAVINRRTHKLESYQIRSHGSSSGFPTSGFAVVGDVAVVEGTQSIYGISCR